MGYQEREQSVIGKSVLEAHSPLIQRSFRSFEVIGVGIVEQAVGTLEP